MNKRQAKKHARTHANCLFSRHPRCAEASRKACGKWSPWRIRKLTLKFTVTTEDVRRPGIIEQRALDDIYAPEDKRVLKQLEELGNVDSPSAWGHE